MIYAVFFTAIWLIFIGIVILITQKKQAYDERQKLVRGQAHTAAFWTALLYILGSNLAEIWNEAPWCTPVTDITLVLSLSVGVFLAIAVSKDAYTRPNDSSHLTTVLFLVLGGIMLAYCIPDLTQRGIFTPEGLVDLPVQLACGVLDLLTGLLLLWRNLRLKQERAE